MNNVSKVQHDELIRILDKLIKTIKTMRNADKDFLLKQNENEAKEWIAFLKTHRNKEELKSLENEISDRLFFKFDVQIGNSKLDDTRTHLMKTYIFKSNEFLK